MRITVATNDTAVVFLRRAGYGFQKETSGEVAFVRRVGGGLFPRYHAYVTEADSRQPTATSGKEITINLHVDQKAPTYGRNAVHSGEYDGPLVEQEAARLRALASTPRAAAPKPPEERKGFFRKLFR